MEAIISLQQRASVISIPQIRCICVRPMLQKFQELFIASFSLILHLKQ